MQCIQFFKTSPGELARPLLKEWKKHKLNFHGCMSNTKEARKVVEAISDCMWPQNSINFIIYHFILQLPLVSTMWSLRSQCKGKSKGLESLTVRCDKKLIALLKSEV